jgi:hypothetical protein
VGHERSATEEESTLNENVFATTIENGMDEGEDWIESGYELNPIRIAHPAVEQEVKTEMLKWRTVQLETGFT